MGRNRVFVWTPTGSMPHVAPNVGSTRTLCGRPVDCQCDAFDVLYREVCQKCRRSLGLDRWNNSAVA